MFYAASGVLVKAGIAMTLLRLTNERKYRWPILAVLVATPVFTATVVLILVFNCRPVGAQFDLALGSCPVHTAMSKLSYPFTAMTIILDWGCAVIPWLVIRGLQLNERTKKALIAVLGLGGIASLGAIARLPYIRYYTIYDDQLCKLIWAKSCIEAVLEGRQRLSFRLFNRPCSLHRSLVNLREWSWAHCRVSATTQETFQVLQQQHPGRH